MPFNSLAPACLPCAVALASPPGAARDPETPPVVVEVLHVG